jgi:excisionase family DNA binding protein
MEKQEKNPSHAVERVLFRPRTVALMADLSVSQVYKLIENGTLKSVRIGRSVRVPAGALDELIQDAAQSSDLASRYALPPNSGVQ